MLQGARDERERQRLFRYLAGQPLATLEDPADSHIAAARIDYDCRRRGLTVRGTIDCRIAEVARGKIFRCCTTIDYDAVAGVRPLTGVDLRTGDRVRAVRAR